MKKSSQVDQNSLRVCKFIIQMLSLQKWAELSFPNESLCCARNISSKCYQNSSPKSSALAWNNVLSLVVIKLPYLFSTILVPELSKGMGHHDYGEPAWPNDILYIFPIVIFGIRSYILGLAIREPLNISSYANPFGTPFQILAEWYLFPTLHLLRILSDKFMGILSILAVPTVLLLIPFGENLSRYQNPIRRPIMVSIFLSALIYSIWLSCISLKLTG